MVVLSLFKSSKKLLEPEVHCFVLGLGNRDGVGPWGWSVGGSGGGV